MKVTLTPFSLTQHCCLWLLLFILSGCSLSDNKPTPDQQKQEAFAEFKSQIALVVGDQQRQQQLLSIVNDLEIQVDALLTDISERKQRVRSLNTNYHATREQFVAIFDETGRSFDQQKEKIITQYRTLKKLLSPEEANKLDRSTSDLLKSFALLLNTV